MPELIRQLDAGGVGIAAISLSEPSLDDVFLTKTGRSLRDASPAPTTGEEAGVKGVRDTFLLFQPLRLANAAQPGLVVRRHIDARFVPHPFYAVAQPSAAYRGRGLVTLSMSSCRGSWRCRHLRAVPGRASTPSSK